FSLSRFSLLSEHCVQAIRSTALVQMSHNASRNLDEENNAMRATVARLTEANRQCEEENRKLRDQLASQANNAPGLSSLQLPSINNAQLADYTSKFAKEFTVTDIMGVGGGGCVFKAVNKHDEWEYAVKRIVVDPRDVRDGKLHKILREVRAMAKLDHQHIIRYNSTWIEEPPEGFQLYADDETLKRINSKKMQLKNYNPQSLFIHIQMQLCNYSLTDWLNDNKTPDTRKPIRMKMWFKQMVSGVEYIHDNKLIHRDLKPCNILFTTKDHLKICDLGIAVEQKVEKVGEVEVEVTMTRTGTSTEEYMSPEQSSLRMFNESRLTTASDVFTLGLILAELYVVMDDYAKKVKIFDNYRRGKPDNIFDEKQTTTAQFIEKLTKLNRKERLTCKTMHGEIFMS
ncbi:hypothetical protein PENTCL1PPCAC_23776, partial [Pristionchus entomophagus]